MGEGVQHVAGCDGLTGRQLRLDAGKRGHEAATRADRLNCLAESRNLLGWADHCDSETARNGRRQVIGVGSGAVHSGRADRKSAPRRGRTGGGGDGGVVRVAHLGRDVGHGRSRRTCGISTYVRWG